MGLNSLGLSLLDPDYQLKDSRVNKHVQIDTCHPSYSHTCLCFIWFCPDESGFSYALEHVLKLKQIRFFIWSISSTYSKSSFWYSIIQPHQNQTQLLRQIHHFHPDVLALVYMDVPRLPYGCFRKEGYPQTIHFNEVFHYKLSILVVFPLLLETSISFSGQVYIVYTCHPLKIINQWVITSLTIINHPPPPKKEQLKKQKKHQSFQAKPPHLSSWSRSPFFTQKKATEPPSWGLVKIGEDYRRVFPAIVIVPTELQTSKDKKNFHPGKLTCWTPKLKFWKLIFLFNSVFFF